MDTGMFVVKRDGRKEAVHFDKITARIRHLCYGLDQRFVDPVRISQKVVQGVYSGVTTSELDELAAQTAAYSSTQHPDLSVLAARIVVSNLHKNTTKSFSATVERLHGYVHPKNGQPAPLIADDVYEIVMSNRARLDAAIVYDRDFDFDYFGFKTLEKSYLFKLDGRIAERPQHMLMRVSLGIHKNDIDAALETYELMSRRYFIHATPTLFNAGTPRPQLSSCFLLSMRDDSIEGIYETLKQCAMISKYAGGIGLSVHNIRATGSYIRGSNGNSNGLVPMLRVFNDTARYVDQGGGKRKGSFAIYLEPWHVDIFEFLLLKRNHGNEMERARDLFYGLWIPDLFMERVESNGNWSLFCPNEAPGLQDVWGDEFRSLYLKYEEEGKARTVIKAQTLWFAIIDSQIETGTPYMLFKDACNAKSNQQNLGTIHCSNLCTEIVEYTSKDEVAVCNLASVNLSSFVSDDDARTFDYARLQQVVTVMTKNLNKVIDINFYPIQEARNSNMRHRPIGIGVQGLADMFAKMRLPFDSPAAKAANLKVFETMYYAALDASCDLARLHGPYESYAGSPISMGMLQFDLWHVTPGNTDLDWNALRLKVAQYGVRNSLLLAPMPTASTAQILGNNESIEPFTSNMYTRRVLAGEFTIVNKYLLKDLVELGLWTSEMRNQIIAEKGSIQDIMSIPQHVRDLYKTVWEIKQRNIIDLAADRGPFICQSQSLNIHIAEPTISKMTSMHFYAWRLGLKTGMYYLRSRPKADAIQFTVDRESLVMKTTTATTAAPVADPELSKAVLMERMDSVDSSGSAASVGKGYAPEEICTSCSA